jgi:DNA polymerase-3 subunit delta
VPPIFFRRKPSVEAALRRWSASRLLRVMDQLANAALDLRRQPALAGAIAQRALLAIAAGARSRE